jgi:purine-nucleoside phosphorylase
MSVAGLSCITNLATGISSAKLSHGDVTEVANKVREKFARLISGVVEMIHADAA